MTSIASLALANEGSVPDQVFYRFGGYQQRLNIFATQQYASERYRGISMSKFREDVRKIVELVGLDCTPMAGRFSSDPSAGDSVRKLSICDAFNAVRHEKVVLCLSRENCSCSGGRHFTGLEILPLESIARPITMEKHRVYDSLDTCLVSIRKQPQPVKRGDFFTLGLLESFEEDPDLVFLFVNPAQADRILGLASFRGVEPFMYYPASSICSTITNVLAKGRPEINLISTFEREAGKWSPNELVLAMPLKDFEEAIVNIPKSGYGNTECP